MKNSKVKTQVSISQRKLHSLLQMVFSTAQYTIDTAFNTPTHWAHVYKVTLDKGALYQPCDKTYIVRVLNLAQATLEERQKEILLTQKMSELGIAPKMYYGNPYMGVMVMEYIPSRPMKQDTAPYFLTTLAHKLKKLHGLDPRPYMPLGSQKLESLWDRVLTITKPEPNLLNPGRVKLSKFLVFEQTLKAYTALSRMLEGDGQNSATLCHLDLNKTNILFDGEQAWIIDWDMADQGDPYFDLATVINTLNLSPAQEEMFLYTYFEKPLTDFQTARLHIVKQLCYLRYALTTFGLCTGYKALPTPQGLMKDLKPAFVFPVAEDTSLSRNMALYMLALGFYQVAKTNMTNPKFRQALQILNHSFQEPLHEHLKSFCHH